MGDGTEGSEDLKRLIGFGLPALCWVSGVCPLKLRRRIGFARLKLDLGLRVARKPEIAEPSPFW